MRSDRPRGTRAQLHRGELITALLRAARLCESICAVCWYFGGGCGLWFVAVFIPWGGSDRGARSSWARGLSREAFDALFFG